MWEGRSRASFRRGWGGVGWGWGWGVLCIAPGCSCQQAQPVSGTEQPGSPPGSSCPLHTAIPWVGSGQDLRPRLPLARGEWCLVEGYEQPGLLLSAAGGIPFCSLAFWRHEPQSGH